MLINTNDALIKFCAQVADDEYITVDTEFMRDRSYWSKLCLIQIAGANALAAIDPLAEGLDLAPVLELLQNPKIMKVWHSARQDLEIFYHMTGKVPTPIADSQVMGMACGLGDAIAYDKLVANFTKFTIDKTTRFTDWSVRPLSEKQVDYALDDVRHLRPVYEKLLQKIKGREAWIAEEMAILENPETYKLEPEDAWQRVKGKITTPKHFALLRELAAWREREAQHKNVPRNRVVRDETLLEIVYHAPRTSDDLGRVRGFQADMAKGRIGQAIFEAIKAAEKNVPKAMPDEFTRKHLPSNIGPIADILKVLLKTVCEEEGIAPKLLANSHELDQLAADDNADIPATKGWRYEVFGKKAQQLKTGKLAMRLKGKSIEFFACE